MDTKRDAHKTQEVGYQYFKEKLEKLPSGKRKPGILVEVSPQGKFTVCESPEVALGKVDKIIVLKSESNVMTDKSLSELAKLRVEARGSPATTNYTNLRHYIELRPSCWIAEQVGRESLVIYVSM